MNPHSILVNGDRREYAESAFPATVLALVESLGINPQMVVAEVNGEIVKRDNFAAHPLASGDKIELVRFVGGG